MTAGIAEAPSPKVDCLPSKDEAEPGRGWIRKKTTEWKLVTNFQYSASHFRAIGEVEGEWEFCLDSFVLEEQRGGWKKGEREGEAGEILEPSRPGMGFCFLH